MLMAAKALLDAYPNPSREEIRGYMSGNLCRCGSYEEIVEAIQAVAAGKYKE
jgi:aerobic-type carbon monoxide dehydrogenase small subunit (CoxS/CutS family)